MLKTHDTYLKEIKDKSVICLESYINSSTPILHKCKNCGKEWLLRPNDALRGRGCLDCYRASRVLHNYADKLDKVNNFIKVCEEYINCYTKIEHECLVCSYKWKVKPSSLLSGHGCPMCAPTGVDTNKPTRLYYICIDDTYYKIGITNRTVSERFIKDIRTKDIRIVWEHVFDSGIDAQELERDIKIDYQGVLGTNSCTLLGGGYTETTNYDFLGLEDA